jgi:ferritin-like protein
MAHEGYHEPYDKLPEPTRLLHRALASLIEEIEAVDWYYQRAAVTDDAELRAILLHNAHEEIEHASMTLEWVRRHDTTFDTVLREYLFRPGSIVGAEAAASGKDAGASGAVAAVQDDRQSAPRGPGEAREAPSARPIARVTVGSMRRAEGAAP